MIIALRGKSKAKTCLKQINLWPVDDLDPPRGMPVERICANTYPTLGPIAQCRVSLPPVRGVPQGRRDDYAMDRSDDSPR